MSVDVSIKGDLAIVAKFDSMGQRLHDRLLLTINKLGLNLHGIVITNLSGRVLKRQTGRLSQSQNIAMVDEPNRVETSVGFNRQTVPYGAIHEFGGTTKAHLIEAKNAKALRFVMNGELMFRRKVNHPGSKMPERSFLRSALKEIAPEAVAEITKAVAQATGDH
jgi:phage gpG-like protein